MKLIGINLNFIAFIELKLNLYIVKFRKIDFKGYFYY